MMSKRVLKVSFFFFWCFAVVLGISLRTVQLFRVIDLSTGFYKGWDLSLPLLDIVLAAAVLGTVIFSLLIRSTRFQAAIFPSPALSGLISLFCAAGICCTDVTLILQKNALSGLSVPNTITLILSLGAAIAFIAFSFRSFLGRRLVPAVWQIVLVTLWGCVQVFSIFIDDSSRSNTSEYVIVISTLCLMILFFVKLGRRCLYPNETRGVSFLLIGSSALMSILGLSISLPNIIAACFGLGSWFDFLPVNLALFPISIFVAGFFATNCLQKTTKKARN